MNLNYLNIHNNPHYILKVKAFRKSNNFQVNNIKMKKKKLDSEFNLIQNNKDEKRRFSLVNPRTFNSTIPAKENDPKHLSVRTNSIFYNRKPNRNSINPLDITAVTQPKSFHIKNNNFLSKNIFEEISKKYQKVIAMNTEYRSSSSNFNEEKLEQSKIQIIDSLNEILNNIEGVDLDNNKYKQSKPIRTEYRYSDIFLSDDRKQNSYLKGMMHTSLDRATNPKLNSQPTIINSDNQLNMRNVRGYNTNHNIDNFSQVLSSQLKRINPSYGKIDAHKRFQENNRISLDHFKTDNYDNYRTNVVVEHKALFRAKLKPLIIPKEQGMETLAGKIFSIANSKKKGIK